MNRILLFVLLSLSQFSLFAQDKPKWDVTNPSLGGVPYSDVEFTTSEGTWMCLDISPDGKTIVFDMLGDIYTMPITGGTATCIRSGLAWEVQPRFSPDGKKISFTSDAGGGDNIWYMNPDGSNAKQITKEGFQLLNNAEWIDNEYIVARKHFTSTRSLGAGELWMYHLTGGSGIQLTKRKNDQQDVNEPSVSPDGRYIYFSEDMYGGGFFQYNKNPNTQIFAIRRYDREEGKIEDVTGGAGGACRPQVSPDGKWLAFVRRDDTKTVLCVRELATGLEYPIYDELDKDQQEAWTVFGCYPGFSWVPDGKAMLIWAKGQIYRIVMNRGENNGLFDFDMSVNMQASSGPINRPIPFTCNVKTKVAETLRFENKVFEPEFTARAIRNAVTSPDGKTLVFNAAGLLYKRSLPDGEPKSVFSGAFVPPVIKKEGTPKEVLSGNESEASFSSDGKSLVFVKWDDERKGSIGMIRGFGEKGASVSEILNLPRIYRTPSFSPDGKQIVFRIQDGDDELGPAMTDKPGIYIMDADGKNQRFVSDQGENPRFSADGKRIFVQTGGALFGALDKSLKSYDLNGKDEKVHVKSKYAHSFTVSPDGKWLAFIELHKTYICAFPQTGKTLDLSADTKAVPATAVSRDAGYNLHWSGDSQKLHYTLGEEYFTIDLKNRFSYLPGAPDSLPALPEAGLKIGLTLQADKPEGTVIFENARIITMEGDQVIENGAIVVYQNKIESVETMEAYSAKMVKRAAPVKIIDCKGKTIMPGMIDVHAHPGNFRYGLNPQKQWEYHAQLAYGVTTQHDPSVNSEMAFSNAEMLKSGRMIGPRLYSTGTILYGADGDFKAPINSFDDARSTLRRTKAWGAFSVKSYNQPRREQRQQVIAAARELNMLVVPEGGSFFHHNLTQIVDGHTGIEHNIPIAPLYNDVVTLWGKTKTHNTPTLIVNYGGLNGEYQWYQNSEVWKKRPLLNFTPKHILDERSRHRTMVPEEEYRNGHILVSKSCTKLQNAGVNINLGAHGQLNGLGAHWELWMIQQGGMSNLQALRCATLNGAKYLGMDKEIGSLATGKLADLIVLDKNPLENIQNTESIRYVMVNGRLFESETLNEIGNYDKKRSKFWFEQPGSQTSGAGMSHTCHEQKCVCGH